MKEFEGRIKRDDLTSFVVELQWIFARGDGIRREIIQFITLDQITKTRFCVNGKIARDKFTVQSIYPEHNLTFLNPSNHKRLRDLLKEKIIAAMPEYTIPNFGPHVVVLTASNVDVAHVSSR